MMPCLLLLLSLFLFGVAHADPSVIPGAAKPAHVEPVLRFSDIVSGPSIGLGDGLGDGAVVTVWGQGLGAMQGPNRVYFTDAAGNKRAAAHVYYWKNADGLAPGGPANLYKSHRMQEIAFSIPESAEGSGTITVEVDGVESNALSFTVRSGRVLWVAPSGSNANPCTFDSPCAFVNGNIASGSTGGLGDGRLLPGDIVYSRGVAEPEFSGGGISAGMFLRSLAGTAANPIAIVAYPGEQSTVVAGTYGVNPYYSSAIVVSKYHISVGQYDDPIIPIGAGSPHKSNFHIRASRHGRAVGNLFDENDGKCFNGTSGAIESGGEGGSDYKAYGNHFYDLGCDTTSHFQHTTYMSVRNPLSNTTAWDFSYNHLENNKAKYGIHFYDESYSGDCGLLTGTLKVNKNIIVNQKGAGIHIKTVDRSSPLNPCWSADVEVKGNILVNVGLGPVAELNNGTAPQGIDVGGHMTPATVVVEDNLLYGYADESGLEHGTGIGIRLGFRFNQPKIVLRNNVFWNDRDLPWLELGNNTGNLIADANLFHNTAGNIQAVVPTWPNTLVADPGLTVTDGFVEVAGDSPLLDSGADTGNDLGIYGGDGAVSNNIGPIEVQGGAVVAPTLVSHTQYYDESPVITLSGGSSERDRVLIVWSSAGGDGGHPGAITLGGGAASIVLEDAPSGGTENPVTIAQMRNPGAGEYALNARAIDGYISGTKVVWDVYEFSGAGVADNGVVVRQSGIRASPFSIHAAANAAAGDMIVVVGNAADTAMNESAAVSNDAEMSAWVSAFRTHPVGSSHVYGSGYKVASVDNEPVTLTFSDAGRSGGSTDRANMLIVRIPVR